MYEPITVVKVRKETTIKVPAGGWVIIGQPDEPLHSQINRRAELIKDGAIHDKFERLLIGRLQSTHPNVSFVTKAEAADAKKAEEAREKSLASSHSDAVKRQEQQKKDAEEKAAKEHAERLKKVNAINDAIRNRSGDAAPVANVQID